MAHKKGMDYGKDYKGSMKKDKKSMDYGYSKSKHKTASGSKMPKGY